MQTRSAYDHRDDGHGAVLAYVFVFAILLFLLVGTLALHQVTSPQPARNVLEAGIVALTDIDTVLAEREDDLHALAESTNERSVSIPGYPLDIQVAREEIELLPRTELRTLILQRSSALVYDEGIGAFDRTGGQSLHRFSSEGLLEIAVGQLTSDAHGRATIFATILGLLAGAAALAILLKAEGYRRVSYLGFGGLSAGLIGFLLSLGAGRIASGTGSDDPFARDIRTIVLAVIDVPQRDYGIVAIAGAVLVVVGLGMRVIAGREQAPPDADYIGEFGPYDEYDYPGG